MPSTDRVGALSQGLIVALVVMIGILSLACSDADAEPVEKITVANIEEYSTLIWIAQEQGYFRENGLDVTNNDYQSGKAAGDALLAGEADVSVSADFVLVSHSFTNPDLRVLGTVDTVDNIELIADKDNGITELREIKGRTIGVTKKSVGEFFLGTLLTFNGLSLEDVTVVDIPPRDMAEALLRGDVDAVLTWAPNTFDIKRQLGTKAISWPAQSGQRYNMVLMTTKRLIEDTPRAVERFIESIVQAEEFVRRNNETAKSSMAQKYGYDAAYMSDAWPRHNFVVKLSQELFLIMEDQARWRIENGLTDATASPNYFDFIYLDALEAARPEAVTIIR